MTSEKTQIKGIASLIAMFGANVAYKSGYYHRLLMEHCIVQPTSWSPDSLLAFLMAACTPHAAHEGGWGADDFTAVGILRFLSFWDCFLVTRTITWRELRTLSLWQGGAPPSWRPLVRCSCEYPDIRNTPTLRGETSTCDCVASVICD